MEKYTNYYTKEYFEEYARITLNDILHLNLINRTTRYGRDRPDLISIDEKIGVEVTSALTECEGRHNKLFQQNYPHENRIDIIKKEAVRLNIQKDLIIANGFVCLKKSNNKTTNYHKTLINTINKKLILLNKINYNKYSKNQLYIQASSINDYYIEELLDHFSSYIDCYEINFDTIYICNLDNLFVFHDSSYFKLHFNKNFITKHKKKALKYSKNCICKTGAGT